MNVKKYSYLHLPLTDEVISGRIQSIIKTGIIQDSPILNIATDDNIIKLEMGSMVIVQLNNTEGSITVLK